jgi:site-specific DNA-cytosine methylase
MEKIKNFLASKKPKALDLFSGTKSVAKILQKCGFEVLTLDANPRAKPDILANILEWPFQKIFKKGDLKLIFASVPCTEYSQGLTTRKRNLEYADSLVKKTLSIINFLQPPQWYIENPRNGLLKERDFMEGINFLDVDYCSIQ